MNFSLTPQLEAMISTKVESGQYSSASEVVRAGLRLLHERDEQYRLKLEALRQDIQKGIADLEAGRILDGPEAMGVRRRRLLEMKRDAEV